MKQTMPVATLVDEACPDSNDYADGDHPGYYSVSFDLDQGLLTIGYEADDDADYASTSVTFLLGGKADQ